MTVVEKVASIPPAAVFVTSITGLVNWQDIFYIVSIIWVLLQIAFRLHKEWESRHKPPESKQ
jgi:hypothetical protein